MKTNIPSTTTITGALLLFCAGLCQGQTTTAATSDYSIVQRGPDSRVWQRCLVRTNAVGTVTTNLQSYTEIATGICYLPDGSNGQYLDSVEQVEPVAGGAQAVQGGCQVWWALNANTPGGGGAVVITAPGLHLSSSVYGLAYYDSASGSNATIARLQDCNGAIVQPNQVLYAGAFSNLTADVLYTYTKAGLSQDVVLRQSPPPPDAFGLSDENSVLEIYTEFFSAAQPEATAVTNGNLEDCEVLDFGAMKMGVGQAVFMNGQGGPIPAGAVSKQWISVNNRQFLIESIPYGEIANLLQQLPAHTSNLKPGRGSVGRMAFLEPSPTVRTAPARAGKPMRFAKAEANGPRLITDYEVLSSTTNLTLEGGRTYLVSSLVNITGILTIEGGTVVKYTTNSSAEIAVANPTNFVWQTGPVAPAALTSMNDDTVGTVISNSTGAPAIGAATYLNFGSLTSGSPVFRNLRCSYAGTAILGSKSAKGNGSIGLWDCQFINCGEAFSASSGLVTITINADNVLFSQCGYVFACGGLGYAVDITCVNVTADQVGTFLEGTNCTCCATNSLFTSVTNVMGLSSSSCYTGASSNGIFQTVGAAGYYLATNSSHRGAGTTNIPSAVLTNLQTLTTYPPTVYNGTVTTNLTLSPQVLRNTGTPDLGYHYFPIDWAVDMAVSDATVTVLPGTVVAGCGPQYGVWLYANGVFNCWPCYSNQIYIVRYNTVQEQSNTNWASTNWEASVVTPEQADGSAANITFTDWSVLAADGQVEGLGYACPVGLRDCQFYNGGICGSGPLLSVSNCLLRRVSTTVTDSGVGNVSETFYNNLFYGGELAGSHTNSGIFTFRDNLFNQTSNTLTGSIDVCSNNAYVTTNYGVLSPTNGVVILSSSPAFQTGALGVYYYPTNLSLIHAGSQSAAAADLYGYTVTTNNVIEGTNTVSIGYHYLALSNGLPIPPTNGTPIKPDIPTIITQPSNQVVFLGNTVQFPVNATNTSDPWLPLTYQWYFNGAIVTNGGNISGATNSTLTLSDVQADNEGTYYVIIGVVGGYGAATSSNATLSEIDCGPIPAVNLIITTNGTLYVLTISTTVTGITYDLLYATNESGPWTTNAFMASANPTIFTTNVASTNAFWSVLPASNQNPPVITTPPSNEVVAVGSTTNFSVTATGRGPLSYQWQFNGTDLTNGGNISGATSTNLTITNVQATNFGAYTVMVSNVLCWASATALLVGVDWVTNLPLGYDQWGYGVDASPALSPDGSTVYIASTSNFLYALNATNGAILWSSFLQTWNSGKSEITSSAAITSNGEVYIGSAAGGSLDGYFCSFTANLNYTWSNELGNPLAWVSAYASPGRYRRRRDLCQQCCA